MHIFFFSRVLASSSEPGTVKHPQYRPVVVNRELHSRISPRSCRHIEFSLQNSSMTFETGDHLGVLPRNDDVIVSALASRLGASLETSFSFREGCKPPLPTSPDLPDPCRVGTALARYVDINAVVRRPMLELCAIYAQVGLRSFEENSSPFSGLR
jgi:NADPH-ferrihemoprotein reductase